MNIFWHGYKYYPYEKELAVREVASLLETSAFQATHDRIECPTDSKMASATRLTYFSKIISGHNIVETAQSRLERTARNSPSRQATRYSVHGLHEYKGRFNPQVVKALLNIFRVQQGQLVLDPFCGSGTTLVECAQMGISAIGVDINPFATFLANAKLRALITPVRKMRPILESIGKALSDRRNSDPSPVPIDDDRSHYMTSWFGREAFTTIEIVRQTIESIAGDLAPVFLAVASNLLRDYSLQDPKDLRVRRRKTPRPSVPFHAAFLLECRRLFLRLDAAQDVLEDLSEECHALQCDITAVAPEDIDSSFDVAITSPPYAMALPYIDTQRLSLVWLNMVQPRQVSSLESRLIGSREIRGTPKTTLRAQLESNSFALPESQVRFCLRLLASVGSSDGFRRKAVPLLLYRYLSAMQQSFRQVRRLLRPDAPFALIVGHNHTVLGGSRIEIDTPKHLASLATSSGWVVKEMIPLQTYRRYGYHVSNSVAAETLVILS